MRRTSKTCYSMNVLYFTTWPLQFINLRYENHFTAKSSNELQNAPRSHLEENRPISSFSAEGSLCSLTHQEFIPHLFSSKSLTNYILHLSHPTSHYTQYKYHPKKKSSEFPSNRILPYRASLWSAIQSGTPNEKWH